jgi:hypothetical protein
MDRGCILNMHCGPKLGQSGHLVEDTELQLRKTAYSSHDVSST